MGLLDLAVDAVTPWYIKWPIRALGGIKAGIAWVFSKPIHIALTVAALALAWGFYERHEAAKWQTQATHCAAARAADKAAADAAEAKARTTTHIIAETNIANRVSTDAAVDADADRYVPTHRVRLPNPAPIAPSAGPDTAIPADPTAVPIMGVGVSQADFTACNGFLKYGIDAHDLIERLIAGGLAEPETDTPDPKG